MPIYQEIQKEYGTIGRWFYKIIDGEKHLTTINMGAQLYFKTKGTTQITLNFKVLHTPCAIVYQINEQPPQRCLVKESLQIANHLNPQETYTVKLIAEDIPETNDLWKKQEGIIFTRAVVDPLASIQGILPQGKKILFIGDSITAGIGVRSDHRGQPYSGGASINYAAVCSQELDYIDLRCAFGYTGIVNPGPLGIPNCIGYMDQICTGIAPTSEEPDFIVLNHGTNDALHQQSLSLFEQGYGELLDYLRESYPHSTILALIPFGQYLADSIRLQVSERAMIHLIETKDWKVTYVGDGVHVDINGSQTAGKCLSEVIKELS